MLIQLIFISFSFLEISSLIIEPINFYHGFDKGLLESSEGFSNDFKQQYGAHNQIGVNSDQLKKKSFNEGQNVVGTHNKLNGGFKSENKHEKGLQDLNQFSQESNSNIFGNKKNEAKGEGSLSKGHNSKGEQNYHHKDEYSKSSTFFDEENDEGDEFESKGENSSFDDSNHGQEMKNEKDIDYNQGFHSNSKGSNQGAILDEKSINSQHDGWLQRNGDHYKGDHTLGFDNRKYDHGFSGSHLGNKFGNYKGDFFKNYPFW